MNFIPKFCDKQWINKNKQSFKQHRINFRVKKAIVLVNSWKIFVSYIHDFKVFINYQRMPLSEKNSIKFQNTITLHSYRFHSPMWQTGWWSYDANLASIQYLSCCCSIDLTRFQVRTKSSSHLFLSVLLTHIPWQIRRTQSCTKQVKNRTNKKLKNNMTLKRQLKIAIN